MARRRGRFWGSLMLDAAGRHWARIARSAATADLDRLRDDEVRARALARRLDEVILTAETRLALPRIGSSVFALPSGTDWSWRPDLWRATLARRGAAGIADRTRIDDQASIFHDCPLAEITLRQTGPQAFVATVREADLSAKEYEVLGDQWQLDARDCATVRAPGRATLRGPRPGPREQPADSGASRATVRPVARSR